MIRPDHTTPRGLLIALGVMAGWAGMLLFLLTLRLDGPWLALVVPLAAVMTFLYTGLFITAHDAMHGLVAPRNRALNDAVGSVCTRAYALFSFRRLRREHQEHHRAPASGEDPDFHDGVHRGFWRWYLRFVFTYVTWKQIAGMAIVFNVLQHLLGVPAFHLTVFWVAPSILSTLQLFTFGTYLPHRELPGGYADQHRARSNDYPALLSFITCYHFGYHWEHHAYPSVPWWQLPVVRNEVLARSPRILR